MQIVGRYNEVWYPLTEGVIIDFTLDSHRAAQHYNKTSSLIK